MIKVRIALVLAVSENGVIGRDNRLPWRISSDLKRFRALTMGKPMIMGRKQYESVGRPLEGRDNIVLTRNRAFSAPGIYVVHDLDAALALARDLAGKRGVDEIMVIGGADVFRLALPLADRVYLSEVHASVPGDVVVDPIDRSQWREVSRERAPKGPKDDFEHSLVVLERAG